MHQRTNGCAPTAVLQRRYYSIYDDDRGLVGFAKSIHPDEAATETPENRGELEHNITALHFEEFELPMS